MAKSDQGIVDSVHQRLLNKSRETDRPFNELLQYYAMEKFLLRMSKLQNAEEFVLKGALLLRAQGISEIRSTRDIDVLRFGDSDIQTIEKILAEACEINIEGDGLNFDPESVRGVEIREQEAYDGIRVHIDGNLGNAGIRIQVDIGFGDVITPGPMWIEYPTILDDEHPRIKAYTLESSIAEKYQTMVKFGLANSRMKDFYDIYFLSGNKTFEGPKLQKAIEETIKRRETPIPTEKPIALTEEFARDDSKLKQWNAFRNKISDDQVPSELVIVVERIVDFLWPVTGAINGEELFDRNWQDQEWKN